MHGNKSITEKSLCELLENDSRRWRLHLQYNWLNPNHDDRYRYRRFYEISIFRNRMDRKREHSNEVEQNNKTSSSMIKESRIENLCELFASNSLESMRVGCIQFFRTRTDQGRSWSNPPPPPPFSKNPENPPLVKKSQISQNRVFWPKNGCFKGIWG